MSLPRNIDLTEHGDFGGEPIQFLTTVDEKEITREIIFGRRGHKDQRNDIFDPEENYKKYWEHTCFRCGKNIKIPWNNIGGVCKECDRYLSTVPGHKVPWKKEEPVSLDNVFDLR